MSFKPSGFTFHRVVIIQSLEPQEVQTGAHLFEYMLGCATQTGNTIPVELVKCGYAKEFLHIISVLTSEANNGVAPMIHIECHGHESNGLEFANGSTLTWDEVATALLPLNIATNFNLTAVFSACFGAYFLGQIGAIRPAPCWCMLAPTKSVDPGEIQHSFRTFYLSLYSSLDLGTAFQALSHCQLSDGRWLCEPAELWFHKVVTGYIEEHCTLSAGRIRAKNMHRQLKKDGVHKSIGSTIRKLKQMNSNSLPGRYFDRYFCIQQIPENSHRFSNAKKRLEATLRDLRSTKKYVL